MKPIERIKQESGRQGGMERGREGGRERDGEREGGRYGERDGEILEVGDRNPCSVVSHYFSIKLIQQRQVFIFINLLV